ncbi:hypothetical protein APA82_31850 [Pseudomonas aeruginosa]|nr:hypothetical protein APA82_31850 [Pseudomonas aeruginosa]
MQNSRSKDRFGDDVMVTAVANERDAGRAAIILAWCRGIRHVLTPISWAACAFFAYQAIKLAAG